MNKERIAYAILMAVASTLAAAGQVDGIPPKVAMWALLLTGAINGFLRVLWPTPPDLGAPLVPNKDVTDTIPPPPPSGVN